MTTQTVHNFDKKPANLSSYFNILTKRKRKVDPTNWPNPIRTRWYNAEIDMENLSSYLKACFLKITPYVPAIYPQVMAFPLHLKIMADSHFPFSALGSLHFKNKIIQKRPLLTREKFDVICDLEKYEVVSQGLEFSIETKIVVATEVVWEGVSSYLIKGKFGEFKGVSDSGQYSQIGENSKTWDWKLGSAIGKKYAGISGDINPIHISSIAAKFFGLKKNVAHGMCVLGQSLRKLDLLDGKNIQITNTFKGPFYLGSSILMKTEKLNQDTRFDIFCGNNPKPCMQGKIEKI